MNKRLIDEANMRVKSDDTCIHVGDFSMRGGWKYRRRLNGNWFFMRGNHDKNNKVKSVCDWMFLRLANYNVFVTHVPYYYHKPDGTASYLVPDKLIEVIETMCDFAVCGHVHEKWDVSYEGKIPCINVGVDVRDYRPMSDAELIMCYERIKK